MLIVKIVFLKIFNMYLILYTGGIVLYFIPTDLESICALMPLLYVAL